MPTKFSSLLCLSYPRSAFGPHPKSFADVEAPWQLVAKVYFALIKNLCYDDSRAVRLFLEATRSAETGDIVDYSFICSYSGTLDVDVTLKTMLDDAAKIQEKKAQSRFRSLPRDEDWTQVGSEQYIKWVGACAKYAGGFDSDSFRNALLPIDREDNPVSASRIFSLPMCLLNRSRGIRSCQRISAFGNYAMSEEGSGLSARWLAFPSEILATDVYEVDGEDIMNERCDIKMLPECQTKMMGAKGVLLDSLKVNKDEEDDDGGGEVDLDDLELYEALERARTGYDVTAPTPQNNSDGAEKKLVHQIADCTGSIYTALGSWSSRRQKVVLDISDEPALDNPMAAARRLHLDARDLAFDEYVRYCHSTPTLLSPTGRLMAASIDKGGANARRKPQAHDPRMSPWAFDRARKLREYIRLFKATESSAALISLIRDYMHDAFFVDLNRVRLNLVLNSWEGAKSKSFSCRTAASTFPKDVVSIVSYVSEKAFFTNENGPNQNDSIMMFDDVTPGMLDRNSQGSQEAIIKFVMSTCTASSIRNVEDVDNGGRKREKVYVEMSHCFIFCGNLEWLRCSIVGPAMKTRVHIKEVDEGKRATTQIQDAILNSLLTGKDVSSPEALQFKEVLAAESCLFFEAAKLIGTGALKRPTTFTASIVLHHLQKWMDKRQYPCDQVRDSGRLISLARIKCLQNAIYDLFFVGKYKDTPYSVEQMKDLEPLLYLKTEHVLNALGEQADLFYNPHENAIMRALYKHWKAKEDLDFWGEGKETRNEKVNMIFDDGEEREVQIKEEEIAYMRFHISSQDATSNFEIRETNAMAFKLLGEAVRRIMKESNNDGEVVPTVDSICDYLHSITQRQALCRTWTKSTWGQPGEGDFPPSPDASVVGKVERNGKETETERKLALYGTSGAKKYLLVQIDQMRAEKDMRNTHILMKWANDFLKIAKLGERKIPFCPNPTLPGLYDMVESKNWKPTANFVVRGGAFRTTPAEAAMQGTKPSEGGDDLAIDRSLDLMAKEARYKELYITGLVTKVPYVMSGEEGNFFGKEIVTCRRIDNAIELRQILNDVDKEEIPDDEIILSPDLPVVHYPEDILHQMKKRKRS